MWHCGNIKAKGKNEINGEHIAFRIYWKIQPTIINDIIIMGHKKIAKNFLLLFTVIFAIIKIENNDKFSVCH